MSIQAIRLPKPSADECHDRVTDIRGRFIGQCFFVENDLIILQLLDQFSTDDPTFVGSIFFEAEGKLRKKTLGAHLASAKAILTREFDSNEISSLLDDLTELVEVRNVLAHSPSWVIPINEASGPTAKKKQITIGFCPEIANDKHIWKIDETQVIEWLALVERCKRVGAYVPLLRGRLNPPKEKHDLGGFPMGIIIPRGDPLGHRAPIHIIAQTQLPFRASEN